MSQGSVVPGASPRTMTTPAPDWQPTLRDEHVVLRALRAHDLEPLYAVASDPLLWEQHPEPDRHRRDVFERFFAKAMESRGALLIAEAASGRVIGSSRYYDWDPVRETVAVGYTFLARSHWGGTTNPRVKSLMLTHAFRHARTVWFHVGPDNVRSQRALERIGARLDHRGVMSVGGSVADRMLFRIDRPTA